jgi:hypothetical protein
MPQLPQCRRSEIGARCMSLVTLLSLSLVLAQSAVALYPQYEQTVSSPSKLNGARESPPWSIHVDS